MADIRCTNCGNNNPDFLDVCQFCQSPLKSDSTLHTGDTPKKVDTGELEPILPEWLKEARKQNRESSDQDAVNPATLPNVRKSEAPDLLAGLSAQNDSDDDEVPDWLAGISSGAPETPPSVSSKSDDDEPSSGFFAQFSQGRDESAKPFEEVPAAKEDMPFWNTGFAQDTQPTASEGENLSRWFTQDEPESDTEDNTQHVSDMEEVKPDEPQMSPDSSEDLSWLHQLEESAKKTGELSEASLDPVQNASDSSQKEPDWLNALGGTDQPSQQPGEDLSWLEGMQALTSSESSNQVQSPQEDLGWLEGLNTSVSNEAAEPIKPEPDEDIGWLNNLGGVPVEDERSSESRSQDQDDPSWLNDFASVPAGKESLPPETSSDDRPDWLRSDAPEQPAPVSKPISPFSDDAPDIESMQGGEPDWLKDAMEEPSMPAPGAVSMDWFTEHQETGKSDSSGAFSGESVSAFSDSSPSSDQVPDVDSLFDIDMPEIDGSDDQVRSDASISSGDELAPVELPSWVQAMRPVESVVGGEGTPTTTDQRTEQEGPLAGFQGVIPAAPIGSTLRPKAVSLKLQATDEQQAGAALMDQIIAGEATAHPLSISRTIASQRVLRWALSLLVVGILGLVISLGSQMMPVVAPASANHLSEVIASIPDNAPVLVVIDYEPSFAGELEVTAGPILDQLALARKSTFTFISTTPTGSAMADRLMANTGLAGLGYQAGTQYFNLGYLPGGSAGVMGFLNSPVSVMPLMPVSGFSEYAALLVITDTAESGRIWVEQVELAKAGHPDLEGKPFLMASSAQAGPMLQPYVSSRQVDVMVNGLYEAAKYEFVNNTRPGTARVYWDAFGLGLLLAVLIMAGGSAWNLFTGIRERRAVGEQG